MGKSLIEMLKRKPVLAMAVIMTSGILLLVCILSPPISPISSIHDADGDGVPDNRDAAWQDPSRWTFGWATIQIMVSHPNATDAEDMKYVVQFNCEKVVGGTLNASKSMAILHLVYYWSYGEIAPESLQVNVTYDYSIWVDFFPSSGVEVLRYLRDAVGSTLTVDVGHAYSIDLSG